MWSYFRLLLAAAMNGAKDMNHYRGVDSVNAARRKMLLNNVEGLLIVGVAEHWNDDCGIPYIEVGVAGRKPGSAVTNIARHGNFHDIQAARDKAVIVVFENLVILICRIVFKCSDNR